MRLLLPLLLVACGGASAPAEPQPELRSVTHQPCALEGAPLSVPVAEGWALGSSPEGCLLVDERVENTALTLAALPHDLEGAELLAEDPRSFFRDSGLLGADVRFTGRLPIALLGGTTAGEEFVAEIEGIGPRAGLAVARRVGPTWIVALLFHAPGDQNARAALVRALEATRAGP